MAARVSKALSTFRLFGRKNSKAKKIELNDLMYGTVKISTVRSKSWF
jgi:hypothetical protein